MGRRRTAGLRREEVAQLAGISPAWYTRIEQGRGVHPSRDVLTALADALWLDAGERAYLFQLAYGPRHTSDRRATTTPGSALATRGTPATSAPDGPPPALRRLLDALGPTPALVIDRCWDLIAWNAALAAVLPDVGAFGPGSQVCDTPRRNLVEYVLTSPAFRAGVCDWAQVARLAIDGLRASLAGLTADEPLSARAAALVTHLTAASPEFRAWWPEHGLWAADRSVTHVYEHPHAGRLAVEGTMLDVRSAPGLTLVTYVPCESETFMRLQRLMADAARTGSG